MIDQGIEKMASDNHGADAIAAEAVHGRINI
jgi:hypothetical protein